MFIICTRDAKTSCDFGKNCLIVSYGWIGLRTHDAATIIAKALDFDTNLAGDDMCAALMVGQLNICGSLLFKVALEV